MKTYPLHRSQRWSRISLGVICILFVVTGPIGIWLLILGFRRIEISKDEIAVSPFGKRMKLNEVKRFGYGVLKDLVPGNTGLNTQVTPQHITTIVYVLEDSNGKRMRIGLSNYDPKLAEGLQTALGKSPVKMQRRGLWGLRFSEK